ncbi:MAG: peptidoglycan DD-metalloendopeptidase family protein [Saprospirales bacterium]|nr:peptidoglycan DD-metalloendopeptidase family protein [Saprospirales bacterium]
MKSISRKVLFAALLFLPLFAFSQERQMLEEKRQKLIQDIQKAERLLTETKKTKETTLLRFNTLQEQIKKRKQLIQTLEAEVQLSEESLTNVHHIIQSLQSDVDKLYREYGQMVRIAYRQKLSMGRIMFLFSAHSLNDAFRRWQYLKQYDRYREKQAHLIQETQSSLQIQFLELEARKQEKQSLLETTQQQAGHLETELNQKNQLLKTLKSDESRLLSDLKTKRKAHEQLNSAIEKIIREEMAKARKEERKVENSAVVNAAAETSSNFEGLKGRMSWPVKSGTITGYFGRQEHPSISGVYLTNNGIDIRTDLDATVQCIFQGEVVGVQFIPGYSSYMAIIRHGSYYTVYSNLEEVVVKRGQTIKAQETIGKVRTDPKTNAAEVHFEVWKEKNRMNPLDWLATR